GLRLRPRVAATLEVESGTNDPFAVFLAIVLVEILQVGDRPWTAIAWTLLQQAILGGIVGIVGGRATVLVLNRLDLPQGLHAPFRFSWREKLFVAWVGLRGAVGIFLASIPLLVGMKGAQIYFDVAFVVVVASLLVQGWTLAFAARKLGVALPRIDPVARRVE